MGYIKLFLSALCEAFGFAKQRDQELNSPTEQANAEAMQIQKDRDKAATDIKNPDQSALNRDIAP